MRLGCCLLIATATACSSADTEVTLRFASPEAQARTRVIAFTAFEPLLAQPEDPAQTPRFIGCDEVGVFRPTSVVDPGAVTIVPDLAGVVTERTTRAYPLEDGDLELRSNNLNPQLNPWGAIMVYVEARGDARRSDALDGINVTATLVAGCFCVRTADGFHPDPRLDQQVTAACAPIDGDGAITEREVLLGPVAPDPFKLDICEGDGQLTAPQGQVLSPGPKVCVDAELCDNRAIPGVDCFQCEQPCPERDQRGNVPILFDIFRGNQLVSEASEVVLTNDDGLAEAQVDVGDCSEPVRVEAQVMGRTGPRTTFDVDCVPSVADFDCPIETTFETGMQPRSMTRVRGRPSDCAVDPRACDRLAVLSDQRSAAVLTLFDMSTGSAVTSLTFDGEDAHAVHGFFYEPGPLFDQGERPAVAIATTRPGDRKLLVRVFVWDYELQRLVPHDGVEGLLVQPCQQWTCGTLDACTDSCEARGEVCSQNLCQDEGVRADDCSLDAPVYCNCQQEIEFQDRVTLKTRDLDNDGLADLVVSNNGQVALNIFSTSRRQTDTVLYSDNCTCARTGVGPNTFGLMNLGGPTQAENEVDIVIGWTGGTSVKYANRPVIGSPVSLDCLSPALVDNSGVRDIRVAPLRCRLDQVSCSEFDDVVAVTSGGSINDPGIVRVITGSDLTLTAETRLPSNLQRVLVPRRFRDRPGVPEDPQRAQIADVNGDLNPDIAVLYRGGEEVHVWLGASNGGFGETSRGVVLEECAESFANECAPLSDLVALDRNGDGRQELAVICSPALRARLRLYTPRADDP